MSNIKKTKKHIRKAYRFYKKLKWDCDHTRGLAGVSSENLKTVRYILKSTQKLLIALLMAKSLPSQNKTSKQRRIYTPNIKYQKILVNENAFADINTNNNSGPREIANSFTEQQSYKRKDVNSQNNNLQTGGLSYQQNIKLTSNASIPEKQSNPCIATSMCKIGDDDGSLKIIKPADIPYCFIQEFKSLYYFINEDFRPSVPLPLEYVTSGIKTLLISQKDVHGEIMSSADMFYTGSPLYTFDRPIVVSEKTYTFSKFAIEFFSTTAVKVIENNAGMDYASKYKLAEYKEQAAYLLIRRFYNLTGFLLEYKNRDGKRTSGFQLHFRNGANCKITNEYSKSCLYFRLHKTLGCYTMTHESIKSLKSLSYFHRSEDTMCKLILKDYTIKRSFEEIRKNMEFNDIAKVTEVIYSELDKCLPERIINNIPLEQLVRNQHSRQYYDNKKKKAEYGL